MTATPSTGVHPALGERRFSVEQIVATIMQIGLSLPISKAARQFGVPESTDSIARSRRSGGCFR